MLAVALSLSASSASAAIRRPIEGTKDEYSADIMKIHGVTSFGVQTRANQKSLVITVQDVDAKLHVQSLVRDQIQGFPVVVEVLAVTAQPAK